MQPIRRQQRMARAIRDIVSEAFMSEIDDPRMTGFVSITNIELTPDMRYASIYLRCFGTESNEAKRKTIAAIGHARGFIQSRLASELNVRYCPIISFHEDLKQEKVDEVLKLIDEVSKNSKDNDADTEDI